MRTLLAIILCLFLMPSAHGGIVGGHQLNIDFTKPDDAKANATWSTPDKIQVTDKGLGWDGEANSMRDGWIRTVPIATGVSWRPPQGVGVRVTAKPDPLEFSLPDGQKSMPQVGTVFVRYSSDMQHWSDWQMIDQADEKQKARLGQRSFAGRVSVPRIEREQYEELTRQYSKLDVPWTSDEEAMATWIHQHDADFFGKQRPFIGYVQVMYELHFYANQRISGMNVEVSFGVGGMHSPPKNREAYKDRDGPWRWKAPAPATQPAAGER